MLAMQILHYEFLGPVRLDEWGPPMEDVVYALLARCGDKFSLVYVDQCGRSDDAGFFTKNPRFGCWIRNAGAENRLYVAVYPMFGSSARGRASVVHRIVSKYSPPCNLEPAPAGPRGGAGDQVAGAAGGRDAPAGPRGNTQPAPAKRGPLGFVDPRRGARHYVRRYLGEASYREWFDRNYPGYTIYEGLGISEGEYRAIAAELGRGGGGNPAAAAGAGAGGAAPAATGGGDDGDTRAAAGDAAAATPQADGGVMCACCGSEMRLERMLGQGGLYRCAGCGISETRLG